MRNKEKQVTDLFAIILEQRLLERRQGLALAFLVGGDHLDDIFEHGHGGLGKSALKNYSLQKVSARALSTAN